MSERERKAKSFDEVAEVYDRARPSYPNEMFGDLVSMSGLRSGSAVLEIGSGTGKASVALAQRGYQLTCLEPGEHLAAIARRNLASFPSAKVITVQFENWEPAGMSFDAVFAASSWHWLDPEIRYTKASGLLKTDGVLAIVTMERAFPKDFDPIFTEIQQCYEATKHGSPKWPPRQPGDVPDLREEIENTHLFKHTQVKRYLWTQDYTGDQYVDMINTHSDHRTMDAKQRDELLSCVRQIIGARIVHKHYLTILHLCWTSLRLV